MSNQTFVVVNPASANGRTGRRWPELAARLRARVGEFEVAFTERPRQAGDLVADALRRGADQIVSVGGDGTHNEVVNGLFAPDVDCSGVTLALVPTGTGGDLRRTLGLPNDPIEAIDAIGRDVRRVDAGHIEYTAHDGGTESSYFINIASFGIAGLVDKFANTSSKALGGKVSFLWATARAALKYQNQAVRLVLDDGKPMQRTVNNVVVANARYFGGGMKIAPNAEMTDGAFDVVIVGDLGTVDMARGMASIYRGEHLGRDGIESFRARRVRAEPMTDDDVLIDMDGEQPGRLPATFKVVPGAFTISVGPDAELGHG